MTKNVHEGEVGPGGVLKPFLERQKEERKRVRENVKELKGAEGLGRKDNTRRLLLTCTLEGMNRMREGREEAAGSRSRDV